MATFEIEFSIGDDKEVYDRLIASLPPGQDNLVHDVIVPAHTKDKPVSLTIKNVVPNIGHILQVTSEWGVPAIPTVGFVPKATTYVVTLPLPYGPSIITVTNSQGSTAKTLIAVTNYAVWFRAEAREITEHSLIPLNTLEDNIKSSVAYILATPLIAKLNRFIPTDLETLGTLANKLLVKNLLWRPGTDAGTRELLAAFGASNPVFFAMNNLGTPETPLYRTEEVFSGYEAHMWLPNREVERWRAFIQYLNNLPQLYSLKEVTEGFVYVQIGNRIHQHVFDFESDFANTVLEGQVGDECFLRLFRLDLTFDAEIFIQFCQASYQFDNLIPFPGLETPDTDLMALTNFRDWSLTGRFEQQFDICYNQHSWVYDSPVFGVVDGINRFYDLSQDPATVRSVKLFIDGLLLRNLIDYWVSTGSDFRSSIYQLPVSLSPILLTIAVGDPRPFIGPVLSSFEVEGSANLQYLVTATDQTLLDVTFVISHPPSPPGDPQEARLHYLMPALPAGGYGGANQYGTEVIPVATVTFVLTYPTAATNINYQLFVQYAEDPAGLPQTVSQPHYIVRNHNLVTAIIEFTAPISSPNAKLHWWLIEADNVALERGTLVLNNGDNNVTIPFTNGPYLDPVVVMLQLWNITAIGSLPIPFFSFRNLNPFSAIAQFSEDIVGTDYRLDYAIFPSEAGNLIEIFAPPAPLQLVEAHYDLLWEHWAHTGPAEPVDGLINTFTLPYPSLFPESIYAVLDGRVLIQGTSNQYVVENPSQIRMTFFPQAGQKLWFVYPIADPLFGGVPTSTWHQGYLTRQPDTVGSYAIGTISNAARITPGDIVSLEGVNFEAKQTARGIVNNPLRITPSDSLIFINLGVVFTGVQYTSYVDPVVVGTFSPSEVNIGTDEITIAAHGLLSSTIVYVLSTNNVPGGLIAATKYYVKNPTANTLQLSLTNGGSAIDITDTGVGTHTLSTGALPTEFKVGISPDDDGKALAAIINEFPVTGDLYYAEYLGLGQTEIRAKYLGGTIYDQPLTVLGLSMTVSSVVSNFSPANVDIGLDTITINNHGLVSGTLVFVYTTNTIPGGITPLLPYYIVNPSTNSFQLATVIAGPAINITSTGTGTHTLSAYTLPISGDSYAAVDETQTITFSNVPTSGNFRLEFEGEITEAIPFNATSTQVQTALNAMSTLQDAVVTGDFTLGFTVVYAVIDGATNQPLLTLVTEDVTVTTADITIATDTITAIGHNFTHAQDVGIFTTGTPPAGLTVGTVYYVLNVSKTLTFAPVDVDISLDTITSLGHGYIQNQIVAVSSAGTLPAGLVAGDAYYVQVLTVNTIQLAMIPDGNAIDITSIGVGVHTFTTLDPDNFQLSLTPGGIPVDITGVGTGTHTISINSLTQASAQIAVTIAELVAGYGNRYPAYVSRGLDSAALSNAINANEIINKIFSAVAVEGTVSLTAKHLGVFENGPIGITGSSLMTSNLNGGVNSKNRLPMLTYKPFYYRDAPVIALDGASTRLYNSYSGNAVQFDTPPVGLQEPYIVSQIFPLDNHPLDSMAANQPCSYPKGNFTQGLSAQLTEIDVEVEEEGKLIITIDNLPLQEQPIGPVDGINTVFDMTLESCAGQDSMMFWIDGIFQNPTQYLYSVFAGHGVITLAVAPLAGQKLWVWYLPQGDACVEEHVVQLTGVQDNVNQTFGIPSSPFVNKPAFVAFLQGLYQPQDIDYVVDAGNLTMTYLGALAPAPGQALWGHFNEGNIGTETWRQVVVGVGDDVTTVFVIPFLLTSELPTSQDSVILALDGLVQREGVDFTVNLGLDGFPTGTLTFAQAPEAPRNIQVAYIRRA